MDDFLTADQTAALLRLHVKRVQALARTGRLPAVRVGRKWLFSREKLMGVLQSATTERQEADVEISARNQLRGKITAISLGGVMAEIRLQIGKQELVSVITRTSVDRLGLRVGDEAVAIIKSTEVMIGKP
jgi:molybdopterin-binding protein